MKPLQNVVLLTILMGLTAISGCSAIGISKDSIENRIVCTSNKDEVHTLSKYGPVSIGSRISDKDLGVCK